MDTLGVRNTSPEHFSSALCMSFNQDALLYYTRVRRYVTNMMRVPYTATAGGL